jgi:hypothetical protein
MPKKLTIEYVRERFEKDGYELLSKEYVNCSQKLNYVCSRGHRHSITWANWQSGYRCPLCAGQGKPSIEFIRSEFEKEGYILLATEYVNNRQKLGYVCPKGHEHNISWSEWGYLGNRCPYCANCPPITIEFIRSEFVKESYTLLTKKYINSKQKLDYICPNKHKRSITWGNWKTGKRCLVCAGNAKPTIGFIRLEFEKEDYILLTEKYTNAHQKLDYICPKGHKHSISWHNWRFGKRCPYCVITASKGEIQVRNFIKSLGVKVSANDRNQIFNPDTNRKFELDIFMPDFNKAIEYNGEYWHKSKDTKNRDLLRRELCKSKNIDLLTIWEKEWRINNKECKSKIMDFIFD